MEKIEAVNRQVNSALDVATGNFVFKVLIRGFEFEKALMQEHFNENQDGNLSQLYFLAAK